MESLIARQWKYLLTLSILIYIWIYSNAEHNTIITQNDNLSIDNLNSRIIKNYKSIQKRGRHQQQFYKINQTKTKPTVIKGNNCVSEIKINHECQLPGQYSYIAYNLLGSGRQSDAYNASINGDSELYVLRWFRQNHFFGHNPCLQYEQEYTLLTTIKKYGDHFNLSFNVPTIYPNMPLYKTRRHCLMVLKQITNAINWQAFSANTSKMLSLILEKHGNIVTFLKNCYDDIMNVHYILFDMDVFHNDLSDVNLLVDLNKMKCYVIDFNRLYHKYWQHQLQKRKKRTQFDCLTSITSPFCKYYLATYATRTKFTNEISGVFSNDSIDILAKYMLWTRQYETASRIFYAFIKLYYSQIGQEKSYPFVLADSTRKNGMWKNHTSSEVFKFCWCAKYELFYKYKELILSEMNTITISSSKQQLTTFSSIFNIFEMDKIFIGNELNISDCYLSVHEVFK